MITIAHHGGVKVQFEIAKYSNILTKPVGNLPDDEKVAELAIVTLSHSLCAAAGGQQDGSSVLESIDMVDVLETVLEAVQRPHS